MGASKQVIPEHTKYQIDQYVQEYVPPGGFVQKVLENDLVGAFHAADDNNLLHMRDIVSYVYNNIPNTCHGSPGIVKLWLETPVRNADYENGVSDPYDYPLYPMDIDNVEPGTMVEFWLTNAGHDHQKERIQELLTLHEKYEVEYVEVHGWHSEVYLKGFDEPFNSVFFADVEETDG